MGLNERQIKAVSYVKEFREITNARYQKLNNIGKSVTATEIEELVAKEILLKVGRGRSTKYVLKL